MRDEERQLWRMGELECVMISCCAGAELQLRRVRLKPDTTENSEPDTTDNNEPDTTDNSESDATEGSEIVLREMYPMKSDVYERARDLRTEHERAAPR
jgi:hypothetical protein